MASKRSAAHESVRVYRAKMKQQVVSAVDLPKSQLMSVTMRHWGSVRFTEPSSELRSDSRP